MAILGVIIPVYNCESYVERAIYSVLNQKCKDIKIILVDDGSKDRSFEICESIAKKESRVCILHQENSGVSVARNTGIRYCINNFQDIQYLAFLDADDVWNDNFFDASVIACMNRKYDLIFFKSATCDASLKYRSKDTFFSNRVLKGGRNEVWFHDQFSFASAFYSISLLREYKLEFMDGLNYSEDKIFRYSAIYLANRICCKDRLLYYYRSNPSSAMNKRKRGIDYYFPIIKGYLRMDIKMNDCKKNAEEKLMVGKLLAMIYFIEMIEEQVIFFQNIKELEDFINENETLAYIKETITEEKVGKKLWRKYKLYCNHIIIFRCKCFIKRAFYRIIEKVLNAKLFSFIVIRGRYPIKI